MADKSLGGAAAIELSEAVYGFFAGRPQALPLYAAFEGLARGAAERLGLELAIRVQKTQISFYAGHMFACVSFARVRKKRDCPENYIVVTLGLEHRLDSPRVDIATEPYPNRWTHHILIGSEAELDGELLAWVEEAAAFAASK